MKLLSVVVPVYNTEVWLRRCLDSVLLPEALGVLELILVNDGSTDGSGAILRDYARRYPESVVLIEQENGGHGAAVNAGLKAAAGVYFRVLDSDDWLDSPGLRRFLQALPDCAEDALVTPYSQEYVSDGREILYDYPQFEAGRVYAADELPSGPGLQYLTLASACYRTELLRRCGLQLFENCSYVDMQYNTIPIPRLRSLRFLDIPLYRYMIGRSGQSMEKSRLLRKLPEHQRVLLSMVSFYAAQRERTTPAARAYLAQMILYMYYTHVHLIHAELPGRLAAFRMLRDFEAQVRALSPELYQKAAALDTLRLSRALGYGDLLLLRRAVPAAFRAARRLRA